MLLEKRGYLINQFAKNNITSRGEEFFDAPRKIEKSTPEKTKESDQLIPKWVQVSGDKFNFIKFKLNKNKNLATMIDDKNGNKIRYSLNDVNKSVIEISMKEIVKNNAIRACNNLVDKAEQISELRSIPSRRKMLEIFNYLGETFRGRETGEKSTDQQGLDSNVKLLNSNV